MKSALRMSLLATATVAALGLSTLSVQATGRPDLAVQGLNEGRAHVAGQLIVQFRDGATASDKTRAMGRVGGQKEKSLVTGRNRIDFGGDVDLINVSSANGLTDAIARLKADASVEFAEPNWIVQHAVTSNDTYYTNGSLWGMYGDTSTPANQYGSQAGEAWAGTAGGNCSTVVIGIIDEGYMYTHPDLAANAFSGNRSRVVPQAARHAETPAEQDAVPPAGHRARCNRQWRRGHGAPVRSRLFQPSRHAFLGLGVGDGAAVLDGTFTAGDAFQNAEAAVERVECIHSHEIRRRLAVLRDEHRGLMGFHVRNDFGGLALERGDEFRSHGVPL